MKNGKVYLVGGGPGNRDLITVKGARLINKADVIVYDRLVGKDIINSIPENIRLINVGKNAGNHPVCQEDINQILVDEAKKGCTVVRLKGGDPYVFGRGGEEIETLIKNDIEFEVVPGITSAVAVPAFAGISVTHREYCSSLHIITGHAKSDGELNIDFNSLVKMGGTLVFLMSVSTFGIIADGLIKAGMDKNMPCAVIQNGTLENQRKFISTLCKMEEVIKNNNVKSPAVIVVGEVCGLSEKLDFFSKRPLHGKKIMVVQSKKRTSYLSEKLREYGAETDICTCIRTVPYKSFDWHTDGYNVIVFTSAVGVSTFFDKIYNEKTDARYFYDKRFACVGEKTAEKLKEYGIVCDFIPSVYDGEHLAQEMIETGFVSESDKVLMFRNEKASKGITEVLKKNRIAFCDRAVYNVEYITEEKRDLSDFDYITFISQSGVDGFVNIYDNSCFAKIKAVCIGETTAKKAREYGFDVTVAKEASLDAMAECIVEMERKSVK